MYISFIFLQIYNNYLKSKNILLAKFQKEDYLTIISHNQLIILYENPSWNSIRQGANSPDERESHFTQKKSRKYINRGSSLYYQQNSISNLSELDITNRIAPIIQK